MKTSDRVLAGLVAGIVLIAVAALAITVVQPQHAYQDDSTPGGVVHNYIQALYLGDFERAYGYLSPTQAGYPQSADELAEGVAYWGSYVENATLAVESAKIAGNRAIVSVRWTRYSEGIGALIDGNFSTEYSVELRIEGGGWKIAGSDRYFLGLWTRPVAVPVPD